MDDKPLPDNVLPANTDVDNAVGVPERNWYVAIVKNRSEKKIASVLDRLAIENYVPLQSMVRTWRNGKTARIERVVIPSMVFVRCTETQRRHDVVTLPFVYRFLTDRAAMSHQGSLRPVAVIAQKEIDTLKFMLGQSDIPVEISNLNFAKGDKVKVTRGSLTGLEGEVVEVKDSKSLLVVRLDLLGCASLTIDTVNLKRLPPSS